MTCVAFPLGRGNVFSGNSNVSVAFRLIELMYLAKLICPEAGGPIGPSKGRIHGCRNEELFVCLVIRRTARAISSASKRENKTHCKAWQWTQPPSCSVASRGPGSRHGALPREVCRA